MIYQIAEKLAETLSGNLSFADLCVGHIKVITRKKAEVEQRFPVIYNTTPESITASTYQDLTPNSKRKSIIYFDNGFSRIISQHGKYFKMEGRLTLVCWFNYEKIKPDLYQDTYLVAEVIKQMPSKVASFGCISKVGVFFEEQGVKDGKIFDKFTYDESMKQYWTYPYDYFTLNYSLIYFMHEDCFDFDSL